VAWTDALLTGLATYLHDGVTITYKSAAPYLPGDAGPVFLEDVPAAPDAAITLATYPVSTDPELNDVVQGLQVRTRTGRAGFAADSALADAVFDRLHGAEGLDLGNGVHVTRIQHISGAALGEDTSGRPERTDNYYVTTNRPSLHRPD
jgi:hypothetical protein